MAEQFLAAVAVDDRRTEIQEFTLPEIGPEEGLLQVQAGLLGDRDQRAEEPAVGGGQGLVGREIPPKGGSGDPGEQGVGPAHVEPVGDRPGAGRRVAVDALGVAERRGQWGEQCGGVIAHQGGPPPACAVFVRRAGDQDRAEVAGDGIAQQVSVHRRVGVLEQTEHGVVAERLEVMEGIAPLIVEG